MPDDPEIVDDRVGTRPVGDTATRPQISGSVASRVMPVASPTACRQLGRDTTWTRHVGRGSRFRVPF